MNTVRLLILLGLFLRVCACQSGQGPSAPEKETKEKRLIAPATGVAAIGYPRVFARLFLNGQPLVGAPASPLLQGWKMSAGQWPDLNLAEVAGPQYAFTAMLDTGANVHMVTLATAERFGMQILPYFFIIDGTFGLTGAPTSRPYGLAISGNSGQLGERPYQRFFPALPAAQFAVDTRARNPLQLIQLGGMNLVGMPAIRRHVFEFDPSEMVPPPADLEFPQDLEGYKQLFTNTAGPIVRVYPSGVTPSNEVFRLPLRYIELNHVRLSLAQGLLPNLTENPVIIGVRASANGRQFIGNWMLDTGSPVSLISSRQALMLGWTPRSPESLSATNLTLRDVTGVRNRLFAMRLEKLEFKNPLNQILEFPEAHVLIRDVSSVQPDGGLFQLDGLIGNNLLLPSLRNIQPDGTGEFVEAPFKRVWIDGFRAELWFEPHTWPEGWAEGEKP